MVVHSLILVTFNIRKKNQYCIKNEPLFGINSATTKRVLISRDFTIFRRANQPYADTLPSIHNYEFFYLRLVRYRSNWMQGIIINYKTKLSKPKVMDPLMNIFFDLALKNHWTKTANKES